MNNKVSLREVFSRYGLKKVAVSWLFVLFFAAVIIIYNILLYSETKEHVILNGEFHSVKAAHNVDDCLDSAIDTIDLSCYSIQKILNNADDAVPRESIDEEILDFLVNETERIQTTNVLNTSGLYAYIRGQYYDGAYWVPGDDYIPTERPWYIRAMESKGELALVDPYLDAHTGSVVITLCRCLPDGESVVALDLTMDDLQSIMEASNDQDDGSIEMVICKHGAVIAHSDRNELGRNYLTESEGIGPKIAECIFNRDQTKFSVSFEGKDFIVYAVPIEYGWYSVSAAPAGLLYDRPMMMILISTVVGLLAVVLILLFVIRSGKKDIIADMLNKQLLSSADIYMSLCELDIVNNTATEIKNVNPMISKAVAECGNNMQQVFFGIMKSMPESPTKAGAIKFVDLSDIDERFKGVNVLTYEYLSYGNIWVRARFVVSRRNSEGKITHVLWMLENIDAERKARDSIEAIAEKLNNQMSSTAEIYMSVYDFDLTNDTFTEVRGANRQVTDIVGSNTENAQAILFNVMRHMVEPSSLDTVLKFVDLSTLEERMRDTKTIIIEYLSTEKKWRRGRFISSEYTADGHLAHVLWLVEDIDQEKRDREKLIDMSDRAMAANEAKSAFLSNMSHEIRTPISAILGMNEMVLRECSDSKILEYSENIQNAGNTLLSLINDILDFSKIEAGKMSIIPVDYDLVTVLNDLVNMVSQRAKAKNLAIITEFNPDIPEFLFGDEVRIKQVVTNILTNAVKYTEQGSVTFKVDYKKINEEYISLAVAVKDTGIGIKKEDIDRLFLQFERVDEKRNRGIEGTGLGMTITRGLLDMMDSSLKVESEYGKGSVFSFEILQKVRKWDPIGDYRKSSGKHASEHEVYHERFVAPQAKVLLVDDTPINLLVFKGLLKKTEVQIDTATSGDEGLQLMYNNKYDVIFLDHMMPQKDGIETLAEFRESGSELNRNTPVICLTANAISGAREKYLESGFDDYLTKPIDSAKLEELLYEYIPRDKIVFSSKKD